MESVKNIILLWEPEAILGSSSFGFSIGGMGEV